MKKFLFLLPLSFILHSCGNKPAEQTKNDTAHSDTAKVVETPPAKPIEKLDPNDSVFEWKRTIKLHLNSKNYNAASSFDVFDNGNIIYCIGREDSCIRIINSEGKVIRSFGKMGRTDSTFRDFPDFVTIGPNGNIYASDGVQSRVLVFDSLGHFKFQVKIGGGLLIGGLAVNKQGTLFVSCATGWMIKAYDASGKFIRDIKDIHNKGGVAWGYFAGVALDSSGAIYLCNWRGVGGGGSDVVVHECDKEGAYLATIPLLLDHGVVMFTVDPVGRIFADAMDGVIVYNHEGRRISKIGKNGKGDGEFKPESINGIRVNGAGYVYVLCKDEIKIFR